MPMVNGYYRRPQLRNPNIDYSRGRFFVTFQVHCNKSVLGAIAGGVCNLTPLGEAVSALIGRIPEDEPGALTSGFIVMPNHVHLLVELTPGGTLAALLKATGWRPTGNV